MAPQLAGFLNFKCHLKCSELNCCRFSILNSLLSEILLILNILFILSVWCVWDLWFNLTDNSILIETLQMLTFLFFSIKTHFQEIICSIVNW